MEDLILKYLKEGKTQPEIADLLKAADIKPNSLSSVEKKLKVIRVKYGAKTMFHLGVIISEKDNAEKLADVIEDEKYNQKYR